MFCIIENLMWLRRNRVTYIGTMVKSAVVALDYYIVCNNKQL